MAHLSSSLRSTDSMKIMLVAVALLVLAGGAVIVRQTQPIISNTPQQPQQQVAEPQQSTAHNTLWYGTWEGNQSVIHGINADGTGHTILAKLPFAIKNIHPLPDDRIIYIADTDAQDHGRRIAIRNVNGGDEQTVVEATAGRGIDSFTVSADARWIAYWEVALGNGGTLSGGRSYVFTAKLDQLPAQRNSIFDETADNGAVVHYPLFFDHNGMLYSDGFSPNTNGWNQGLVQTTVDGANPNPTTILSADHYNSDPTLSPTENTIAYTAYDPTGAAPMDAGTNASGKSSIQALNPNSIMLRDLTTNTGIKLLAEPGRLYYDLTWKQDGSQLFARSYGSDGQKLTDPQALIITPHADGSAPDVMKMDTSTLVDGVVLGFGEDGVIMGTATGENTPGNLGANYEPIISGFAVNDGASQTTFATPQAQFIGMVGGTLPVTEENAVANSTTGIDSLQLGTFNLKPELNSRPAQQNDPLPTTTVNGRERCRDIYARLVGQTQSTTSTVVPTIDPTLSNAQQTNGRDPSLQLAQFGPGAQTQTSSTTLPSFSEAKPMLREQYKCYDSPLYVYSATEQPVTIHVSNAQILDSTPVYQADTGWQVTATPHGTKIDYTYDAPFTAPEDGYIVKATDLKPFLNWYGTKLGLIGKELTDYVAFWTGELPVSDSYQISHFENPDAIMHVDIAPKPATMIQAIMYFKPLSADQAAALKNLPMPIFSDVPARTAFTAVDWSGIIDR